jgi:predicted PurR-regulated permease PerM
MNCDTSPSAPNRRCPRNHPRHTGLPNALSVALVIVLLLGALFAGGTVVGRQLTQLLEDLPTHEANLRDKARFVHFELGEPEFGSERPQR